MMEHENIDRLFQEQLKDIEASPSLNVWTNIEAKLTQKKRRILPIWWFFGGVAALLIVSFFIVDFSTDKNDFQPIQIEQIITDVEREEIDKKSLKINEKLLKNTFFDKKKVVFVKKQTINKNKNALKTPRKQPVLLADKTIISPQKYGEKEPLKKSTKNTMPIKGFVPEKRLKKDTVFTKKSMDKKTKKKKVNNSKKTLPKRTLITKLVQKNKTISKKKWAISPVFGVLNTVAISSQSEAANPTEEFSPASGTINTQENNKAYGVKIAYKFYKKWTLQSGIHLQEHRFSTSNIAVISNTATGKISYYLGSNPASLILDLGATASVLNTSAMAIKTYNYIEIPLEVTYTVMQTKKFNTRLVAGFSTLVLTKNNTTITSDVLFRNFGRDSNLNTINFSGNIGFDFNYSLGEKWKLTINPMLKKQLYTFKNRPNNYNSFLFGIYTGIKYQF